MHDEVLLALRAIQNKLLNLLPVALALGVGTLHGAQVPNPFSGRLIGDLVTLIAHVEPLIGGDCLLGAFIASNPEAEFELLL